MSWLVVSCFSREGAVLSVELGGFGEISEVLPLGFLPVSWRGVATGGVSIVCCCCCGMFRVTEGCSSCRVWSWSSVALAYGPSSSDRTEIENYSSQAAQAPYASQHLRVMPVFQAGRLQRCVFITGPELQLIRC